MPRNDRYLFTSESVSMGHPDKLADQISDGVLDALLAQDPMSRVACETLVTTGLVVHRRRDHHQGRRSTIAAVVREVIRESATPTSEMGFDADTCAVHGRHRQAVARHRAWASTRTPSQGKDIGAGDQGLMFGYACNDTPELMPLPIALAHRILNRLTEARQNGTKSTGCGPTARARSRSNTTATTPVRIDTVVVSTQHAPDVDARRRFAEYVIDEIIEPVLPDELVNDDINYHINPTGRFVVGGPHGDCGLTGRKIIVDTYGGWGRHGGGAFSGKDPTKVDRWPPTWPATSPRTSSPPAWPTAAKCSSPTPSASPSRSASTSTPKAPARSTTRRSASWSARSSRSRPSGIIKHLDLRRPIYRKTAAGGHFGRNEPEFTWERTDKADALRQAAGMVATA